MEVAALFFMIVAMLLIGTPIAVALGLSSITFLLVLSDTSLASIAQTFFQAMAGHYTLLAIPFFILASSFMSTGGVAKRIIRFSIAIVGHFPGGLAIAGVFACMLFAALSGSSPATVVAIGTIVIAGMRQVGYSKDFAAGVIANAGTLGILIPPSIVMIVYGVLAEVSIARLFAAGVLPGMMIAALYSGYVMIVSLIDPNVAPPDREKPGLKDALIGFLNLIPIALLIFIVLGSIYSGIATPSEAAAVGVVATLIMIILTRQMTKDVFFDTLVSAVHTSCMIAVILIAAAFLSTAMGFLHVPQDVAKAIGALNLSPSGLIVILAVFYVLLGMFLEGISITVMSLPITLPLILAAGFDPIWFGVFLVIMVELAQITPPIGFNLFIIQGLTGTPIMKVALAAVPFFMLMCIGVVLLTLFPEIALWLPNSLFDK